MQFSSVAALINAVVESDAHKKPSKKHTLFLFVGGKDPLHFYDNCKSVKLTVPADDLETYLSSYDKIHPHTTVCLQGCQVVLDYGKHNDIISCEIESRNVSINVGTEKESKIKNFSIKLSVETDGSEVPIMGSTRRYLRRMEKQDQIRKSYKPSKFDIVQCIQPPKTDKKVPQLSDHSTLLADTPSPIDTDSLSLLNHLVKFVDKQELLRLLVRKPLRDRASKKAVRMMIVPTDVQDSEGLQVRKKTYDRNNVQELLAEYEAREERLREG